MCARYCFKHFTFISSFNSQTFIQSSNLIIFYFLNKKTQTERSKYIAQCYIVIDSMDTSLSKLWETVKDREACCTAVHWVKKSQTWPSDWTIQQHSTLLMWLIIFLLVKNKSLSFLLICTQSRIFSRKKFLVSIYSHGEKKSMVYWMI